MAVGVTVVTLLISVMVIGELLASKMVAGASLALVLIPGVSGDGELGMSMSIFGRQEKRHRMSSPG